MSRFVFVHFIFLTAVFSGCGSSTKEITPEAEIPFSESFQPRPVNGNQLAPSISKSSLNKEFLFQGSIISQYPVQAFSGLKSRIVQFVEKEGSLLLVESTKGTNFSAELPQTMILTAFPIIDNQGDRITFDFNSGMVQLFVAGDWRASDFEGHTYSPEYQAVYASIAYIESAQLNKEKNQFVIQQVAQIPAFDNQTFKMKYYLSPYVTNANFKTSQSDDFERMGFFEAAPQMEVGGKTHMYATKFDLEKPLVFAVSSNTPREFREAVKDGVLYWNRAFDRDVVKVIDAPKGLTAPDFDYNIVQWVDWDEAGMAYADAQMDPRTGEILHAQVYMTSVFATKGKERGRLLLKPLKAVQSKKQLGLRGFISQPFCDLHKDFNLSGINLDQADETKVLKIAQDYVREVVAHEIGHTLGLRHNFAGSMATNISVADRLKVFKQYSDAGGRTPDGIITTNSVMEYQIFLEGVLFGDQVSRGLPAADYDRMAIQKLYFDRDSSSQNRPFFCTDSHADLMFYADCQRFDAGKSFVEYVRDGVAQDLSIEHFRALESFLRAKLENKKMEEAALDPQASAKRILAPRGLLMRSLSTEGRLLQVRRKFEKESATREEEIRQAELNLLADEMEGRPGDSPVMSTISARYAEESIQAFKTALAEKYSKGMGVDGNSYEFTSQELKTIEDLGTKYFRKLQMELIKEDLRILSADGWKKEIKLEDHPAVKVFLSDVVGSRIKEYVFRSAGSKTQKLGDTDLNLTTFVWPYSVRSQTAKLLNPSLGLSPDWVVLGSLQYRDEALGMQKLLKDQSEKVQKFLNTTNRDQLRSASEALSWFEENKAIDSALSRKWEAIKPAAATGTNAPAVGGHYEP